MGQLERYGLYVLVLVIFLILGVAIWGGDPAAPGGSGSIGTAGLHAGVEEERGTRPIERYDDLFDVDDTDFVDVPPTPSAGNDGPSSTAAPGGTPAGTDTPSVGGAPAVEPTPAPPPARARTHTIARGDTLSSISQQHYGTERHWKKIQAANPGLNPTRMPTGKVLQLPDADTPSTSVEPVIAAAGAQSHVITRGDTLGSISKRYYGTVRHWERIAAANAGLNPKALPLDRKIVIPELPDTAAPQN